MCIRKAFGLRADQCQPADVIKKGSDQIVSVRTHVYIYIYIYIYVYS